MARAQQRGVAKRDDQFSRPAFLIAGEAAALQLFLAGCAPPKAFEASSKNPASLRKGNTMPSDPSRQVKPTIVLVHGAFADSSSWNGVIAELQNGRILGRRGGQSTFRSNARLVAATNRDLRAMVAERTFREDLYYRLDVFPIDLPPLRERRADIAHLVEHFVADLAARMRKDIHSVSARTMQQLLEYDWPGNVRELQNVLERAVILSEASTLEIRGLGTTGARRRQDTTDVRCWRCRRPRQRLPRSHPPRSRRHQLGHRRPFGCCRSARHESHHLAFPHEEARRRARQEALAGRLNRDVARPAWCGDSDSDSGQPAITG